MLRSFPQLASSRCIVSEDLNLTLFMLVCSVLTTSALRGALFRNGRSFIRNQTPMSVEEQAEEPAKRSVTQPLGSVVSYREQLLLRQLLHEMINHAGNQ